MARRSGEDYPERPLMAVLSDLLAISHFSTSRGATVRSDFLRTVLDALGGDPDGLQKDDLIRACVEAATRRPADPDLISVGGTVTNAALQAMVDGVTQHGLGRNRTGPESPRTETVFTDVGTEYDPAEIIDDRTRLVAERAVRQGQDRFRTMVLHAYGSACAVTGSDSANALEAAHITPYRGTLSNVTGNGMCLRADIHRLWDSGLIAAHEDTMTVLVADGLLATTYGALKGQQIRTPRRTGDRPSRQALAAHRLWCGL